MNVGGITNIAIADGTTCLFTRVIPYGIESVAGELAERRGLTLDHAHGWLKHVGLVTSAEDIEGDSEIVVEARTVLTEGVRRSSDGWLFLCRRAASPIILSRRRHIGRCWCLLWSSRFLRHDKQLSH